MNSNYLIYCFLFSNWFSVGCNDNRSEKIKTKQSIPDGIENVSVLPLNKDGLDSVTLFQENIFESNDEVFIDGYINFFTVDNKNRVLIAATIPGTVGIYAFEPDGTFITCFVEEGRGPGEYEGISSVEILEDKLILFDPRLQKIGIFSLDDFSHIKDISIDHRLLQERGQVPVNSKANKIVVLKNGDFLIRFRSMPKKELKHEPKEVYFRLSSDGVIQPDPVLQTKSFSYYYPDGQFNLPFTMPFTRSSILAISDKGQFYTSWTDEALIKIFDINGEYESAIHFPLEDAPVDIGEFELFPNEKRTLTKYKLPKNWQKLHTLEFDDEGQLWVSMITDSDSTFQWAVLDKQKNLIAKFKEQGDRKSYSINSKPNRLIKNKYFYKHEFNLDKGIDRIVKYRIKFIER